MPEILTESFCERCGTRYTFEAVPPKARPLKKLKVLSKGLRNYVLSDETTLDEAFAEARSDEQRAISSQQLDAFHKTFNFCMSCRQYTCASCWNQAEGRCLTCAPHLGQEILPGPFPVVESVPMSMPALEHGNGRHPAEHTAHTIEASAWPTVDLRPVAPAEPEVVEPEVQAVEAEVVEVSEAVEGQPLEAAADALAETPSAIEAIYDAGAQETPDEKAAKGAARTTSFFARFRPGHDRSTQEPMSEAGPAAVSAEAEALTVGAEAGEPSAEAAVARVVAAAPEGPVEGLTPEELAAISGSATVARRSRPSQKTPPPEAPAATEPEAPATTEPEAPAATEPEAPPAVPSAAEGPAPRRLEDVVEVPTWRIVAPDTGDAAAAAVSTPAPASTPKLPPQWPVQQGEPQWPTAPWSPAASGSRGAPAPTFAELPQARAEGLWAESSRDVLNRPGSGVQACVSCGLPLSATARFCRRCGSRQA